MLPLTRSSLPSRFFYFYLYISRGSKDCYSSAEQHFVVQEIMRASMGNARPVTGNQTVRLLNTNSLVRVAALVWLAAHNLLKTPRRDECGDGYFCHSR